MRNNLFLGVAALALVAPATVMAQETTAVIRGTVTQDGAPVAGAAVTVTNVPSGTRSNVITDANGAFAVPGQRIGGPFTVEVTSPQGNQTVTDIFTTLQQEFNVPIALAPAASASQDIVVTASSLPRAGSISNGPATVLDARAISKVASVNRDVRDIERRDPFATLDLSNSRAVSFVGVNPRFNRFTIDGVTVGDTFGLNADASPTGRGPVPYDAIGQVSTSIAPYDFRQSGFQGGVIDVSLKSGTNKFHGTGFYSQSTDSIQGKQIGTFPVTVPHYKSETYGVELDGPIIKDKLFFMVSGERNTDPRPQSPNSAAGVPGLTDQIVSLVTGPAQSVYGYNAGTVLPISQNKDEKVVAKINWNISDRQRLSISYVNAFDQSDSIQNTSTGTAAPSLGLSSDAYRLTELLRAGIAQLNSDWTDNFSTEGRFIYKYTKRGQDPLQGRGFAQFRVCTDATNTNTNTNCSTTVANTPNNPIVAFGPDISRQTNSLYFDTYEGSILTRLRLNGHELKLLADFTRNSTVNNFIQYSAGGYYFDSLAGFNAKNADQLVYAATLNGQPTGAQAKFSYDEYAFGVQDDWQVTPDLSLTYGARYDLFRERDAPTYNPYFQARYGFPNTNTFKGKGNFEPRIDFNYRPASNFRIRGGFGIFAGGSPDIYLGNAFSNTILSNRITITRVPGTNNCTSSAPVSAAVCAAALNGVTGTSISPLVTAFATTNTATLPLANTGAVGQDFRLPSVYKATLSADYKLFGFNIGADYYFSRTREGLTFTDARSVQIGTLPDGRARYGSATNFGDTNYDIVLGNDRLGRTHAGVVRFDRTFDNGFSLGGSYTLQDAKDAAAATSSTISSLYSSGQPFSNPNFPAYGTSADQTKWAFKYNLGYDHAFFGDYRTVFQLFGETHAGRPYSYTMQDAASANRSAVFGTIGANDRYLIYVPTSPTDPVVSYDSAATQTALDNIINATRLKDFRGRIADKNIARSRANTRIDLHLEQEIPLGFMHSRLTVFGDIEDLPNLLNHNWGGLYQQGYPYTAALVQVTCLSVATPTGTAPLAGITNTTSGQTCAQYRYSSFKAPSDASVVLNQSLYLIRVGVKFKF